MKTILIAMLLLAAGRTLLAGPTGTTPVTTLIETSEVIVIGEVTASASAVARSSFVEVTRVLKGAPEATTIAFRWPIGLRDFTGTQTVYGMIFLASGGADGWVAVPIVPGGLRLSDHLLLTSSDDLLPEYSYEPGAAPIDKVAAELRSATTAESDPDRLARAYEALLSLEVPQDAVVAEHVAPLSLQEASSSHTAQALQTTGASLAATVRRRLVSGLPVPPNLSSLLCRTGDPGAVHSAAAIVNTAGVDEVTRRCAMAALRNVHSTSALPALAAALDSPDLDIAYTGLLGLSDYATGQLPGALDLKRSGRLDNPVASDHSPSSPVFEANPTPYLAFWRRWWRCEACKLGEPQCEEVACLGYVAAYAPVYDAAWTCTASGATGCHKNLVRYEPATYKPEPPDAPAPPAVIYTHGYVTAYTATYDANWTCTASGTNGCRKNRLSYSATGYNPSGPDATVPAAVLYNYGYVATWATGAWSGCSATACNQAGWYTRSVWPTSWKPDPPDAARPGDALACGWTCTYTCYDYGLYETWSECYGAGWTYCDTRYKDNGTGGTLTCRHGYE
jgi:hypothetical protein